MMPLTRVKTMILGNALVTVLAIRPQHGYNAIMFMFFCKPLYTIDLQCLRNANAVPLKAGLAGLRTWFCFLRQWRLKLILLNNLRKTVSFRCDCGKSYFLGTTHGRRTGSMT
jgi:hypothetical protein